MYLFSCEPFSFWNSYASKIHQVISQQDAHGILHDPYLVETSQFIISEYSEYINSFLNGDREIWSDGMLSVVTSLNSRSLKSESYPCLYGIISALFLSCIQNSNKSECETADKLLGIDFRRNLDFMEDSMFGIRSSDIIGYIQNDQKFPWITTNFYSLPNIGITTQYLRDSVKSPVLFPVVRKEVLKKLVIWEMGVHASLSAEILAIMHEKTGEYPNRIIVKQYPKFVNICKEFFQRQQNRDCVEPQNRTNSLTALFEKYLPNSDWSSEPPTDFYSLEVEFLSLFERLPSKPDILICTVPWMCVICGKTGKSVIGYFGHPALFQVSDKPRMIEEFKEMVRSHKNMEFVLTDPFLQMQYEFVFNKKFPYIRVSAGYIDTENAGPLKDVQLKIPTSPSQRKFLVWDRPFDYAVFPALQEILHANKVYDGFAASDDLLLVPRGLMVDRSFHAMRGFKGVVLLPYDMDLVCFYEFFKLGIPIFIPKSIEKYLFHQKHMQYDVHRDSNLEISWKFNNLSPFNETSIDVTLEQLKYCDYFKFPGVYVFENLSDLINQLKTVTDEELLKVKKTMKKFWEKETLRGKVKWESVLSKVLGYTFIK
jgi:hypothetical protein